MRAQGCLLVLPWLLLCLSLPALPWISPSEGAWCCERGLLL